MELWESIVLGIVEGLTEYLPVSSTGHLILSQRAMGLPASEAANAYAICIQAGAILAVLSLYWKSVQEVLAGWLGKAGIGKGNEQGFVLGRNIIVAFLPAAFFGLLLDEWIEQKLFGLWPIVGAWFVGGVAILVVSWRRRASASEDGETGEKKAMALSGLTWKLALTIGFIQCLAMWPGTSRSLVTIVGGVLVGLSLTAAVEFSFLLGVVTLCAATVYKAKAAGPLMIAEYGWLPMIVGSLAAWISAVIAVKWMVSYLQKHGMSVFGYYRIALAIGVAAATSLGALTV
ncbi:MAG: undecaprenyl-diphosphate phosphatase [Kofleriaceae bacterium]|nr:undecaprenyl-diphosphate phosphatase [Kofleriaceae bacterium]